MPHHILRLEISWKKLSSVRVKDVNQKSYFLYGWRLTDHFDTKFAIVVQIEQILRKCEDPEITNILNCEEVYLGLCKGGGGYWYPQYPNFNGPISHYPNFKVIISQYPKLYPKSYNEYPNIPIWKR